MIENHICDVCGFSSADLEAVHTHLADEHDITEPGPVGSVNQADGVLTLKHADGEMIEIDLEAWLRDFMSDEGGKSDG